MRAVVAAREPNPTDLVRSWALLVRVLLAFAPELSRRLVLAILAAPAGVVVAVRTPRQRRALQLAASVAPVPAVDLNEGRAVVLHGCPEPIREAAEAGYDALVIRFRPLALMFAGEPLPVPKPRRTRHLDELSLEWTGRRFRTFLVFAMRAQRDHGYVPTIAPRGRRRAEAGQLADAFEAHGLRVWRGIAEVARAG
jgi:hypothetical protein